MDFNMSLIMFIPPIIGLFMNLYWFKEDYFEFTRKVEKRLDELERKERQRKP